MKLTTGKGNILESSGVQQANAFSIQRSAHMFNILSSGLYSDKISAVLREISCNAMDAHIMAGIPDTPFEVKLPTPLDRAFYVKDWGLGLDDTEVTQLYTSYGWSSKQNDENVTGAFGLGSKSPFAYTLQNQEDADGFTVTAVKHGIKRVYTCHLGDEGAPVISKMFEGPADADWPHGVMVTFPVRHTDISEFHRKALEVFRWFTVRPTTLGMTESIPENTYLVRGSMFGLSPESRGPSVVMGNVKYPINPSRMENLTEIEKHLLGAGTLHLFLPIGAVMMTPSREELQYTDATKSALRAALAQVEQELTEIIENLQYRPATSYFEWRRQAVAVTAQLPGRLRDVVMKTILDKYLAAGEPQDIARIRELFASVIQLPAMAAQYWRHNGSPALDLRHFSRVRRRTTVVRRNRLVLSGASLPALLTANETVVFYADTAGAEARVRAWVKESRNDAERVALLIPSARGASAEAQIAFAAALSQTAELQGIPCLPTSSLPSESSNQPRSSYQRQTTGRAPAVPKGFVSCIKIDAEQELSSDVCDVADLDSPEIKLYVYSKNPANPLQSLMVASPSADEVVGINRSSVANALGRICSLLADKASDAVPAQILVLRTEAQARRLKLQERGYVPMFEYFRGQLSKLAAKEPVYTTETAVAPKSAGLFTYLHQHGVIGALHAFAEAQPEFVGLLDRHPKLRGLRGLFNTFQVAYEEAGERHAANRSALQVQHALGRICSYVSGWESPIRYVEAKVDLTAAAQNASFDEMFTLRQTINWQLLLESGSAHEVVNILAALVQDSGVADLPPVAANTAFIGALELAS